MKLPALTALLVLTSMPVAHAEDLTPAQEEAKTAFFEETEEALESMRGSCGAKVALKADFQNFKPDDWSGGVIQPQALCKLVLTTVEYMCKDRPAYKKALSTKLSTVNCTFTGVKPKQKKDGPSDFSLRNMSFAKGVFTLHLHKDHVNVEDSTEKTIVKSLEKK